MKINVLEDLKGLTMQLPTLVNSFDQQSPFFSRDLKAWLTKLEQLLAHSRRSELSKIAALRSDVISVEIGVWRKDTYYIDPSLTDKKRGSRKKIMRAICGQILNRAQEIVSSIMDPLEQQVNEAKDIVKQLLLVAIQNGVVANDSLDPENCKGIWQILVNQQELRPGTQKILSLVSIPEALFLISDLLSSWKREAQQDKYESKTPANLTVLPGRKTTPKS